MNRIIITGNLVRDVEHRVTAEGLSISKFTIANNEGYGDKKHVSFIDVTAFGTKADAISKYFSKGKPIMIEGNLKQENWTAKDGTKKNKLGIILEKFEFMGSTCSTEDHEQDNDVEANIDSSFTDMDVPF